MLLHVEFPRLADTLVEGRISAWYKGPGEAVRKGEPLFAVETDKVNADIESPYDGTLAEQLVPAGEMAEVGQIIATLDDAQSTGIHSAMTAPVAPGARSAPAHDGLGTMRRRIAERMQESRAKVAQGATVRIVDLGGIDRRGRSWTALFAAALARAANVDRVGVAVEIDGGLVVPVLRDARTRSADELSSALADVATRARAGTLVPEDVAGAQFTITNVGGTGTLFAFPLVPAGQPGILAPGAIVDGRCHLTLCYDRAAYDEYAADALLRGVERALHG